MTTLRKANNNIRRLQFAANERTKIEKRRVEASWLLASGFECPLASAGYKIRDPKIGYTVGEILPVHAGQAYSFYVPCDARLAAIAPGDGVSFNLDPINGDEHLGAYIVVDAVNATEILGHMSVDYGDDRLNNILSNLKIRMRRSDVVAIYTDRIDDPAETNGMAQAA